VVDRKIKYSPLEQRILKLIPRDGRKINTLELASQVYDPGEAPVNSRQTVLLAVTKLIYKSDENEEPWEIFRSKQKGSHPYYYWIEDRKR
jgi:hypothetical protein